MQNSTSKKDLLVMKFLHYFITEKNYNPVIVHGIQNEIWLENMNEEFKIVRLVIGYIHNGEQLEFDNFKLNRIIKQIKKKTFTFKLKTLSFYFDLNNEIKIDDTKSNYKIKIKTEKSLLKNKIIDTYYPDMFSKLKFTEEGERLYEKINNDILEKNVIENDKINELFSPKKPIVTYILITLLTLLFIFIGFISIVSSNTENLFLTFFYYIMYFYALNILGRQVENFYGHIKLIIISIFNLAVGALLSQFLINSISIYMSITSLIFGLMGSILYFSFNQRTYMAEALRKQILPIVILNLILELIWPSINLMTYIIGIISGVLISTAVGIKYKSTKNEKISGIITSIILVLALFYISFIKK